MKKSVLFALPLLVACGSAEEIPYPPGVESLTLSAPLFAASTDDCAMEAAASEVLRDWLSPVRERIGAPAGLLQELQTVPPTSWNEGVTEWRVRNPLQTLTLTQIREADAYRLTLRYTEQSTAGSFAWADGTMALDRSRGAWSLYAWNGQPKMEITWERVGEEFLVSHDLVGSGRSALRVRDSGAETVTLQENTETAAVAQWDFGNARGFIEIAGARTCLEQSAESVCQRICDDGQ